MFNKVQPLNSLQLLAEPVCFNKRIKVGKKVISYKQWVVHGVRCIGHVITEDGEFLSHAQVNSKFNLNTDFLTYYGSCKKALQAYVCCTGIQVKDNNANAINICMKNFPQLEKDPDRFMMS